MSQFLDFFLSPTSVDSTAYSILKDLYAIDSVIKAYAVANIVRGFLTPEAHSNTWWGGSVLQISLPKQSCQYSRKQNSSIFIVLEIKMWWKIKVCFFFHGWIFLFCVVMNFYFSLLYFCKGSDFSWNSLDESIIFVCDFIWVIFCHRKKTTILSIRKGNDDCEQFINGPWSANINFNIIEVECKILPYIFVYNRNV